MPKPFEEPQPGEDKKKGKLSLGGGGVGTLLSHQPKTNAIVIGQTLVELSSALESDVDEGIEPGDLKQHQIDNIQYVDQANLEKVSCHHAIKKWAFERLPGLKVPYEVKNRLKPADIEENADQRATLRLLDLAEDFLQISSFCRELQGMQIEMSPHAAGMEFLFEYMGNCDRIEMRRVEDMGLNLLFKKFSRENSMRLRANVSDEFVEMQIIVFRKNLRLGMSPVE